MSEVCERVASALQFFPASVEAARDAIAQASFVADPDAATSEDPYALLAKAAVGDITAQRSAADLALLCVVNGLEDNPLGTMQEGLIFARQAACRGTDTDIMRVVFMLSVAGSICLDREAPQFAGEMVALLEVLANRGDETCATLLAAITENETVETMEYAAKVKARLRSAWGFD